MPAKGYIVVNELYCKACGLCVADCHFDVLALDAGTRKSFLVNLDFLEFFLFSV